MAEIRPFVSIRPQRGKAAEIAALPYDVVRLAAHVSNGLKSRIRPVVGRI